MQLICVYFFFQAEDGIRDWSVTGVQTCALPIFISWLGRIVNSFCLLIFLCSKRWRFNNTTYAVGGLAGGLEGLQIGRASCRERGWVWVVCVEVNKRERLGAWCGSSGYVYQ